MVQEAFFNITIVSIDFTLKISPTCYTLLALIEIEGAIFDHIIYFDKLFGFVKHTVSSGNLSDGVVWRMVWPREQ
jgi:hypothetical protein